MKYYPLPKVLIVAPLSYVSRSVETLLTSLQNSLYNLSSNFEVFCQIPGAKKEAEIHEALDIIFPVLSSVRRQRRETHQTLTGK